MKKITREFLIKVVIYYYKINVMAIIYDQYTWITNSDCDQ